MSFFDLLENEPAQTPEPVTIPAKPPTRGRGRADLQATARQRPRKQKPERLKFLKPCPICNGKEFTHGKNNGFFCNSCQTGQTGSQVIALGHREPQETAEGLPCAGCGSTSYRKEKTAIIFDDGSFADGWHCGGKNCPVVLHIGNKEVDQKKYEIVLEHATREDQPKKYFKAAYPWLTEHLPELLDAGWTRPELFQRGKYAWPAGNWGVAWLKVWIKEDLKVKVGPRGQLIFSFLSSGRRITQTAAPKEAVTVKK